MDFGSSFLPSDILAAFLCAQLEERVRILEMRRRIWETYDAGLREWSERRGVRRPRIPSECDQSYHMYYLNLPTAPDRDRFIRHLKSLGILSVFHYVPLHLSDMGVRFGGKPGDCPVTEDLSARLVRLPFYNELGAADQSQIIDAIERWT